MMEKVKIWLVLLVFLTSCSAYAQEMGLPVRIFNGDEFNSFDVEGEYIAFIGGNQYKDTFPGYFSGDYYGVYVYNINTKEMNLITNPNDKSTERLVSLDNNKVYWMETRVHDSGIFSYDLTTKEEELTNLDSTTYIQNFNNSNKKIWNDLEVWSSCENDECYNEELWIR
mgnify:FL=1